MATYKIKKKTATNGTTEELLLPISSIDGLQTALDGKQASGSYATTTQVNAKYTKPSAGIPKSDLASAVQTSLGKADTAIQTESDPTVPTWAKASSKPSYAASEISGLAPVATSGKYSDLIGKPTIPTVNNGTLTIQKNGTSVGTFTANQSGNTTANITVPTTPSEVGAAPKTAGVYLVKGNTTGTAGTWTGTSSGFTDYYDGLVVAYDIGIEGASTTTLNINGLGAKTVYLRGTTKLTTHYAVGTIILLTYSADNGCWYKADYDANTNTQIRIYRQTSGYNADYPIIVSRTATSSIGTAGTNSSYSAVYGVIGQNGTYTPTINPHTGEGKFKTVTATTFNGDLSGNATTATTADNATKLGGQVASYYATASSIPTKTSQLTNDSGFKTTDNNTTYSLSKSGSTITLTGSDGSTTSVTDSNSTYTVNNGTLTIQKNGTSVGTFTANQSGNTTANITVPTTASEVGALPISGGTIAGTSGDTPLYIKSAHTTASYEGFKRADGTTLGYFGYSSTDNPVVYLNNGGAKTIYHTGNLPTIPTVNNGTLTITENGISKGTFTANQSGNTTIALTNTTYSNATTSTAGLMSAADKTKLDGISNGSGGGISGTWTSGTSGTVKLPSAGTYQVRYGNGYTSVLWWNGTSTATSPLIRINAAGTCYRFYAALSGTLTLKTGTLTTTTETDSTATVYYRRIGD